MFSKRKWPTWEGILVIILLLIAIFSLGFLSEGEVTGNMVKVTGMAIKEKRLETVAEKMVEIT